MKTFLKLGSTFIFLNFLWAPQAFTAPGLPLDIPTVASFAQEFRAPLGNKLRELRRNFKIHETNPGMLELIDSADNVRAKLQLTRSLDQAAGRRIEEVQIILQNSKILLTERVTTTGKELKFSDSTKKIFLEGDGDYALKPGEDTKEVNVTMGGVPFLRFMSSRLTSKAPSHVSIGISPGISEGGVSKPFSQPLTQTAGIFTDIYFSNQKVISIIESISLDGALRVLEFQSHAELIGFQFLNTVFTRYLGRHPNFKVEAMRPKGFLLDDFRFYRGREEIYGLESFLDSINRELLAPYFTNGAKEGAKRAQSYLPTVPPRINLTLKTHFLDQLILISTQLEQAKTNPGILPIITTTINSFISALREGTLEVTDNRPSSK